MRALFLFSHLQAGERTREFFCCPVGDELTIFCLLEFHTGTLLTAFYSRAGALLKASDVHENLMLLAFRTRSIDLLLNKSVKKSLHQR